jgi:hypothetical protein
MNRKKIIIIVPNTKSYTTKNERQVYKVLKNYIDVHVYHIMAMNI